MRLDAAPLLLLCLAACAGEPPLLPDAQEILDEAIALQNAGEHAACRDLLARHDRREFPRRIRDRFELTLASAQLATGEDWDAFQTIKEFADRHPHSELRPRVIQVQFDAGRRLVQSDAGFWIFWSDRRAGRTVLEHLITRYPDNPHLADTLRLLGEMAMADGDYQLAQERFRDLLRRRPDSEWVPLARYRYAMSIVATLQGPDYDEEQMQHASRELAEFLANPPENPAFVADAAAAQERLREWQAERHVTVAAFYRRIGNAFGERHHLAQAVDGFPGTAGAEAASARLRELPPADRPPQDAGR